MGNLGCIAKTVAMGAAKDYVIGHAFGGLSSIFAGAEQAAPPPAKPKAAATICHQIKHASFFAALAGVVVGAVLSAAVGAAAVFITGATGGLGVAVAIGATLAAGKYIGQASSWVTGAINDLFPADDGPVTTGSPDVFIGGLPAARAEADKVGCVKHGVPPLIAEGSSTVFINEMLTARVDDLVACGAPIKQGKGTVLVGGPTGRVVDVANEFSLLERALLVGVEFLIPPTNCIKQGLKNLPAALVKGGKGLAKLAKQAGPALSNGLRKGTKLAREAADAAKNKLSQAMKSIRGGACSTPPNKNRTNSGNKNGTKASDSKCQSGCPVDTSTGAVVEERLDLVIGASLPFQLTRSYDSQRESAGLLGRGWRDSLSEELTLSYDGELVEFHAADGTVVPFDIASDKLRVFNRRYAHFTLIREAKGFAVHDRRADTTRHFDVKGDHGRLVEVRDPYGNGVQFEYDGPKLSAVRHSDGMSLGLYYTTDPQTDRATIAIERIDRGLGSRVVLYTIDNGLLVDADTNANGHLSYEYDGRGRLSRWTDNDKTWARYEYDAWGRCVRSRAAAGLYGIDLEYDDRRRSTRVADSRGRVTEFCFDEDAQLIERVDPLGNSTCYKYDRHGELVAVVDPLGHSESFVNDPVSGVLSRHFDAEGNCTEFFHDEELRVIAVIDALGQAWTYERGSTGQVTRVDGPDGSWFRYGYDGQGLLLSVERSDGARRRLAYDDRNRMTEETDWAGNAHRYEYDLWGRLIGATNPQGGRQTLFYDPRDLLSRVRHADGTEVHLEHGPSRLLAGFTDENGHTSRQEHGAFDILRSTVDAEGRRYELTYDPDYIELTGLKSPDGRRYRLERDAAGRVVREIDYGDRVTSYELDAAGNRIGRTNAAGEQTSYAYDRVGRLVEIATGEEIVSYEYDSLGRLVFAENPQGRYEWEYDALGRCVRCVQNGEVLEYRYDGVGRCVERVLQGGAWEQAEHRTRYDYDDNGDLRALETPDGTFAFDRDMSGNATAIHARGCVLEQGFDDRGGLVEQRLSSDSSVGLEVMRRRYAFDPARNVAEVDDSLWGKTRYVHDRSDRIVQAERVGEGSEAFAYDVNGSVSYRRHQTGGGLGEASVDLDEGGLPSRVGDTEYDFDGVGRLVRKTVNRDGFRPQSWTFRWDGRDRLVEARTPEGQIWRYGYDPLGRRVLKYNPSTHDSVHFLWDGDVLLRELHLGEKGPGQMEQVSRVVVWHHEPGTFRPIAREGDGEAQMVISDPIGAPVGIVTSEGEIVWRGQRSVWGQRLRERRRRRGDESPVGFPGQYLDEETGLFYNRFRYYDPGVGSFISPDPIGLRGGALPWSYVRNPNGWYDPLGLAGCGNAVSSRIKDSPKLIREAQRAGKSHQRSIDKLTSELSRGNRNPGIGTKPIGQGISEARARDGARVYFRNESNGGVEILGKSNKGNQQAVIDEVMRVFGN